MQGSAIAKRSNGEIAMNLNKALDTAMGIVYIAVWVVLIYIYGGGPK